MCVGLAAPVGWRAGALIVGRGGGVFRQNAGDRDYPPAVSFDGSGRRRVQPFQHRAHVAAHVAHLAAQLEHERSHYQHDTKHQPDTPSDDPVSVTGSPVGMIGGALGALSRVGHLTIIPLWVG